MNLCSSGHEEICFEGHTCPFCVSIKELNKEIYDHISEKHDLKKEVEALSEENDDLIRENSELEKKVGPPYVAVPTSLGNRELDLERVAHESS